MRPGAQCAGAEMKTARALTRGAEMTAADNRKAEGTKKKGYSPEYFAQKHRISRFRWHAL